MSHVGWRSNSRRVLSNDHDSVRDGCSVGSCIRGSSSFESRGWGGSRGGEGRWDVAESGGRRRRRSCDGGGDDVRRGGRGGSRGGLRSVIGDGRKGRFVGDESWESFSTCDNVGGVGSGESKESRVLSSSNLGWLSLLRHDDWLSVPVRTSVGIAARGSTAGGDDGGGSRSTVELLGGRSVDVIGRERVVDESFRLVSWLVVEEAGIDVGLVRGWLEEEGIHSEGRSTDVVVAGRGRGGVGLGELVESLLVSVRVVNVAVGRSLIVGVSLIVRRGVVGSGRSVELNLRRRRDGVGGRRRRRGSTRRRDGLVVDLVDLSILRLSQRILSIAPVLLLLSIDIVPRPHLVSILSNGSVGSPSRHRRAEVTRSSFSSFLGRSGLGGDFLKRRSDGREFRDLGRPRRLLLLESERDSSISNVLPLVENLGRDDGDLPPPAESSLDLFRVLPSGDDVSNAEIYSRKVLGPIEEHLPCFSVPLHHRPRRDVVDSREFLGDVDSSRELRLGGSLDGDCDDGDGDRHGVTTGEEVDVMEELGEADGVLSNGSKVALLELLKGSDEILSSTFRLPGVGDESDGGILADVLKMEDVTFDVDERIDFGDSDGC